MPTGHRSICQKEELKGFNMVRLGKRFGMQSKYKGYGTHEPIVLSAMPPRSKLYREAVHSTIQIRPSTQLEFPDKTE